jgi:hypothetical protein
MSFHFQNIKFGVQGPLLEIGLTVWQINGGGAKAWSAISYMTPCPIAWQERECIQQHFLNVLLFSKRQILCPSPLG